MFISLRKSAALQKEILAAIPAINTSVTFSIYEAVPAAIIAQGAMDATVAMELRSKLLDALYEIRDLTAQANINSGISTLVSKLARLEKDIAQYTALSKVDVRPSDSIILSRISRASSVGVDHYSFSENLIIPVLPQASIDSIKVTLAEFKKEKVRIQDELLEQNIRNSIKLGDETVAVLTAQGLL